MSTALGQEVFYGNIGSEDRLDFTVSSQSPSSGRPILTKSSPPLRAATRC